MADPPKFDASLRSFASGPTASSTTPLKTAASENLKRVIEAVTGTTGAETGLGATAAVSPPAEAIAEPDPPPPASQAPPRRKSPTSAKVRKGASGPAGKPAAKPSTKKETPRPAAWVFYATETRAHGDWLHEIQPGRVMFWQHGLADHKRGGAPAYSQTMRRGDRVIVLVADEIRATAVLAGDGDMRFWDRDNARWWPLHFVEVFDRPVLRKLVENLIGRNLVTVQGSVQPLSTRDLRLLDTELKETRNRRSLFPATRSAAIRLLRDVGPLRKAIQDWPELQVDPSVRDKLGRSPDDALPQVFNDRHDAPDLLDIGPEVSAFAQLAISQQIDPPLSIGLFGDWGSGKSFFMEKVQEKIEDLSTKAARPGDPGHGRLHQQVPQIRFNAWHYIETNLWASLVEFIFAELDGWLKKRAGVSAADVDALFDRLSTSRRLKLEAFAQLVQAKKDAAAARQALETAKTDYQKAVAVPLTSADIWSAAARTFVQNLDDGDRRQLEAIARSTGVADLAESSEAAAGMVKAAGDQAVRGRIVLQGIVEKAGTARGVAAIAICLLGPVVALLLAGFFANGGTASAIREALLAGAVSLTGLTVAGRQALKAARGQLDVLDRLRVNLDKAVVDKSEAERARLLENQAAAALAAQSVLEAERRATEASDRVAALLREQSELSASGRLNRFIRDKATNGDYARHLGIIASVHKDFALLSALLHNQNTAGPDAEKAEKKARKARAAHLAAARALIQEAKAAATPLTPEQQAELLETEIYRRPTPNIGRIVLYIDDLDRCPPDKVVDVLQAIHMLLYFPLFVVFVAVDARWLKRSLGARFETLIEIDPKDDGITAPAYEDRAANAQDYLEKIFQIPFSVAPMDPAASVAFVAGLTKDLVRVKPGNETRDADQAIVDQAEQAASDQPDGFEDLAADADLGLPSFDPDAPGDLQTIALTTDEQDALKAFGAVLGGSPRRTKRFVNTYILIKIALGKKPALPRAEDAAWSIAAMISVIVGFREASQAFFEPIVGPDPPPSLALFRADLKSRAELNASSHYLALDPVLSAMAANPRSFQAKTLADLAPLVRRYAF